MRRYEVTTRATFLPADSIEFTFQAHSLLESLLQRFDLLPERLADRAIRLYGKRDIGRKPRSPTCSAASRLTAAPKHNGDWLRAMGN